ncbi:fimbrial protein [Providencia huaxiensis]|uniref:fimbrial protein n=1 Tax=Providencia huaxiensis TaxID=2027290 RepID=UPI001F140E20|nr:fimbrial protein [Providencia huaxiensis]
MKFIVLFTTTIILIAGKANAAYNCFIGQPVREAFIDGKHIINIPFDNTFTGDLKTIIANSSAPLDMYVNNIGKDFNPQCNGLDSYNSNIGPVYYQYAYANRQTPQTPLVTNVHGISQYVRFVADSCPSCPASIQFPRTAYNYISKNAKFGAFNAGLAGHFTLTLVKTGPVTKSGYIDSGIIATKSNRNEAAGSTFYKTATLAIRPNSIYINVLNCSLKQGTYNINLGDWYDTQFKKVGDTSSNIDIPIKLSCAAGTNIKVNVTSDAIDNAPTGKLSLRGSNKATGVAVQLLDNASNPIPLNTQWTQQNNVPESDYIFGWKARYIKTADKITPGSANATATVNIRYE